MVVVMMGMPAMLIMVMVMVVVVIMPVIMVISITVVMCMIVVVTMIVRLTMSMIVAGMNMRVRLGLRMLGIGAALGIERRFDLDDSGPQPLHHCLDHVIPADAQALRHDLRRQMAVAEMPGDPDQMMRIAAADFHERLGGCDHLDEAPVLEYQRIAAAQRDRVLEVEQEFEPARPGHSHAPPVPVVEIEHDGVGGGFLEAMLSQNLGCADHRCLRASGPCRR
ncbi:hypothetical protein ACVINW_003084 [Bradyrhizobium sp. USDA 4461]